jgi:hypothetical protein
MILKGWQIYLYLASVVSFFIGALLSASSGIFSFEVSRALIIVLIGIGIPGMTLQFIAAVRTGEIVFDRRGRGQ